MIISIHIFLLLFQSKTQKEHQRRLKCAENISLKLGVPTVEIVSLCEFIRKNGFEILDFLLGKGG